MSKWEYRTLLVCKQGESVLLRSVDGDSNAAVKQWVNRFMGRDPVLFDLPGYLKEAGQEGWEVAGLSSSETGGEYRKECEVMVVLKRPAE
jgi:hypothetical protein